MNKKELSNMFYIAVYYDGYLCGFEDKNFESYNQDFEKMFVTDNLSEVNKICKKLQKKYLANYFCIERLGPEGEYVRGGFNY